MQCILTFAFYDSMVVFDHIRKVVLVVALADTTQGDTEESRARAEERLDVLCRQLAFAGADVELSDVDLTVEPVLETASNFTREQFCGAVEKCREYIRAGDVFQVVISQRLECSSAAAPSIACGKSCGWASTAGTTKPPIKPTR